MASLRVEICLSATRANLNPYKEEEHSKYLLEELFKQTTKERNKEGLCDPTFAKIAAPLVTKISEGMPAIYSKLPPKHTAANQDTNSS